METSNRKTGNMVQIWFLLENVNPVDAVKRGIDASTICRECPFAAGGGCYVNVGQAPLAIWKAYHRGAYGDLIPAHYSNAFAGRKIRFGAYGNPTLLPLAMVKAIASVSSGWTGYFHDWKSNPLAHGYSAFFMASTETENSLKLASALGFRTFHVSPVKPAESLECLSETRNLECSQCINYAPACPSNVNRQSGLIHTARKRRGQRVRPWHEESLVNNNNNETK
jgi:hypothetical protein